MSSRVKYRAPWILSLVVSCSGDLFSSANVTAFIGRRSIHHLFDPSCFGTNSVPTADSDLDSRTFPFSINSCNCFLTSMASSLVNLLCFALGNFAPSRTRIARSYGPYSGSCYFLLQKTSLNFHNSLGNLVSTSCIFRSYSFSCLSGLE